MARRFTNLLLLGAGLLPAVVSAQAFGRFGYTDKLELPGFSVDKSGFVARHPASDHIQFAQEAKVWKPTATSDTEQTVALGGPAGNPAKVRASLLTQGFALYFEKGLSLKVSSTAAPYLTWREGSAASGVPTPNVRWVVLSFRDAQPAIVLGFPGRPASLQVTGVPGAWKITGPKDFQGWLRVGLPQGLKPAPANSAASLGRLAQAAADGEEMWASPLPELKKTEVTADEDAVVATWTFDRPGVLLPRAVSMAFLGGYPLRVLSPTRHLSWNVGEGPVDACSTSELKVRLPVRRVPTGRGLSIGAELGTPIGTASPFDLPSVVELALESLAASRDTQTRKAAEDTYTEFLSQANYAKEPWTGQLLPYELDGKGIDLAAAHAFLSQAVTSSTQATSEANSLLTSVAFRRDWMTWLPWCGDIALRRRAAALSALTGVLCPEPERRLSAAMFQAGLSAERGLQIWRRRTGQAATESSLPEPMLGLRQGLFRLSGKPEDDVQYVDTLLSPVRVYGDVSLRAVQKEKALALEWPALEPKPSIFSLGSAYPITMEAANNLPRFRVEQVLGTAQVHYTPEAEGICQARLVLPDWAKPLPASRPVPRYSEPSR